MSQAGTGQATLGKYEIRGKLGRGAMGVVLDGWDPLIGRRVAIKTVPLMNASDPEVQESLARFKREAQAAGRLSHPNIVGIFDYGETDAAAYIVMEFVQGQSLKERLDSGERFSVAETVRMMEQILAALQYSHERGVVHRDIKCANVMLTQDGRVKLADFGVARIEGSTMTQDGSIIGTPAYMSPEQLMGQPADARSDIYSAGVVLYQLLAGERPFDGGLASITHKVLNTIPPRPSEIALAAPPELDAIVARAMSRRPHDRYASASAFSAALAEAYRSLSAAGTVAAKQAPADDATAVLTPPRPTAQPPRATSPVAPPPAARPRGRGGLLAGGAIVGLLLAAGAGWYALHQPPAPPPAKPEPTVANGTAAPVFGGPSTPAPTTPTAPTPSPPAVEPPAPPAPSTPSAAPPSSPPPAPSPPPTTAVQEQPVPPPPPPAPSQQTTAAQEQPAPPPSPPPAPPVAVPSSGTATPPPTPPSSHQAATAPAPEPIPPARVTPEPAAPPPAQPPQQQAANTPAIAPPVTPSPTPPAIDPVALRMRLGDVSSAVSCTTPHFVVTPEGDVRVSGPVGTGTPDAALQSVVRATVPATARVVWNAHPVPSAYCGMLDLLRPILAASDSGLALALHGNATLLREKEPIRPDLRVDFPAYVQVDYLSSDGSVTHLFPSRTSTDRIAEPGVTVSLDELAKATWVAGIPFGTDMIVAVASSVPLFAPRRLTADDTVQTYVPALQAAIDAAKRKDAKVVAQILVLTTLKK